MENKPVFVSVEELRDLAHRLRKLADACDVAVRQMQTESRTAVLASGHPTAEQSLMVLHSFVNSAIGEAFNPTVPLETGSTIEKLRDRETWAKEIHERVIKSGERADAGADSHCNPKQRKRKVADPSSKVEPDPKKIPEPKS
jgi:hypothetical protein